MALIKLEIPTLDTNGNLMVAVRELQDRLNQLAPGANAQIEEDVDRIASGPEIVGYIAMGITVIDHSKDFVAALRRLIPQIKKLAQELGLSKVAVDISGKPIPIAELEGMSDDQLARADRLLQAG